MTALKWIAGIAVGLVWCALVFIGTWWLTFPSDAVVDRVAFEVQKGSKGTYALKAGSASPWWTGLSMSDVMLMSVDKTDGSGSPILVAKSVSARTSLSSLIGGGLPVTAVVELGDSDITLEADLDRSQNPPKLRKLDAEAPALSVGAIGSLLRPYGADLTGKGDVEIVVDAEVGDNVKEHDGRLRVQAKDLLVDLTFPDPISGGDFVLKDMKVSDLELVLDVKDGQASLKRGRIVSDRATIDLDIDVTLNDNFERSRMNGTMVVSKLGGELAALEPAFASAKWDDDKYHYSIRCPFSRLSASCVRPDRQPRSARPRPSAPRPSVAAPLPGRGSDVEPSADRVPTASNRTANPAARRPSTSRDDRDLPEDEEFEDEEFEDEEFEDEEDLDEPEPEIDRVRLDVVEPLNPDMVRPPSLEAPIRPR